MHIAKGCQREPAPPPHCSGELAPSLSADSTQENGPWALPSQYRELALVVGVWLSCPEGLSVRELTLSLIYHRVAWVQGSRVRGEGDAIPYPSPPPQEVRGETASGT